MSILLVGVCVCVGVTTVYSNKIKDYLFTVLSYLLLVYHRYQIDHEVCSLPLANLEYF